MATGQKSKGGGERISERGQQQAIELQDACDFLASQHVLVDEAFMRANQAGDGEGKRAALTEIADLLTVHTIIEEQQFYPAVRNEDTDEQIQDSYDDHDEVKRVLVHLLELDPNHEDFTAELEELQGLIEAHVEEEEDELFPRVRELLGPEQLQALARDMSSTVTELQQKGPPHEMLMKEVRGQGVVS